MIGPLSSGLSTPGARSGRSWTAPVASASLHAVVMAIFVALSHAGPAPTAPRERRPLTFVMMVPPPAPHEPTPVLTMPAAVVSAAPTPAPVVPIAAPAPEAPAPAPKPLAHSEPAPAPPEPTRSASPEIAPPPSPVRTPPPVAIGVFADTAPTVHEAEPAKSVRSAGFDTPSPLAKTGDTKSAASVGAFDVPAGASPARTARVGAIVAPAGFGNVRAEPTASKPPAEVRSGGFDTVRAAPAAPRAAPPPERVDVPLEIVFKPTPVYTEEARALKLEGDVLLDVEFAANGTLSVLRVVRGLGHGLDEAATRAAAQIRFKPAQSAGQSITFRTTVHIVFRLA